MAKKKTKTKPPKLSLFQKIQGISAAVQDLPCTGRSSCNTFCHTEAKTIFPIFAALFNKYNVQPYYDFTEPVIVTLGSVAGVQVGCKLFLQDLDDPQSKAMDMGTAYGQGFNYQWSCDSAQTVAKKLVLQYAFDASWNAEDGLAIAEDKGDKGYMKGDEWHKIGEVIKDTINQIMPKPEPTVKLRYKAKIDQPTRQLLDIYIKILRKDEDKREDNAILNELGAFMNSKYKRTWPKSIDEVNEAYESLHGKKKKAKK